MQFRTLVRSPRYGRVFRLLSSGLLTAWAFAMGLIALGFIGLSGCGSPASSDKPNFAGTPTETTSSQTEAKSTSSPAAMEIPTISLGSAQSSSAISSTSEGRSLSDEEHRQKLMEAMMPLQVLLGTWRGTTQREFGQFKATDEPNWVWDFQTDRKSPAMVMTSSDSPYIREARLTYLPEKECFQLKVTDSEGIHRTLEGTFKEPVQEFQGDDQQMHVRYKLELTEVDPAQPRDQWQIAFNQQENNRYLQEMAKKRGANFLRVDTVAAQRQGTSFAKSDAGYGEKECVISGGLGTIQLTHKGKSYWVCCTGCKAAFEEDPESWIAEYNKKKQAGQGS